MKKVLLLGSGALKIGQAGEFDYSGSQALKALREEGIESVLINPNIATIQTSEGVADRVYFLPITPQFVEEVIKKERPDGILLAFGGQTALNCGTQLYLDGTLEKYGVKVLGTSVEAIMITEDRDLFVKKLNEIDVKTPVSQAVENIDDALEVAHRIGYPVMVRSGYALGGLGSGICNNDEEFITHCESALAYSRQILVEESLKGWKEIEFEVIRDSSDLCFTVVPMENFDPLGIHTGESIVVAPIVSLKPEQIKMLEDIATRVVRHIGIVGECNIQYAFNAETNDYRIIEINARLSRSSALASKASGYPLAFVAAKLALGYTLDQIGEPGTPYSAAKAPEVDYIMQKGLRMIGQGMHGFVGNSDIRVDDLDHALTHPTDTRIFAIAQALQEGYTPERVAELTKIDIWFIDRLNNIVRFADSLRKRGGKVEDLDRETMLEAKKLGFSDFQISRLVENPSGNMEADVLRVRNHRKALDVTPRIQRINTVASEYPELTNYLYVTYGAKDNAIRYDINARNNIIVLGSGAYRIGSSVEFDWCSVNAASTCRKLGYKAVMINYNPETVSTDYDMCDRLYFDELSFERVMDIIDLETPRGVIVSVGGQIPNNLAMKLYRRHVPVLGTSPVSIDRAENRHKFSAMLDQLGIDQPRWKELTTEDEIHAFVEEVGFPVLIRPSYVLSGAAMNVCYDYEQMHEFLGQAAKVSKEYPVVVSEFLQNAKEIEFDAVARNGEIVEYAISEHVEYAGVHSGDATLVFPAQKIYMATARRIKRISARIAEALNISGPFNIQYLAKDNYVKVIECNLRASRSFPFVSKVLKKNFIETATRIMLGEKVEVDDTSTFDIDYIGVKASQFSFARLHKADPVLGVDMSSTGEVGCLGRDFDEALLNAMISVGHHVPVKGVLVSSGDPRGKVDMLDACRLLDSRGYKIYATVGTAAFLNDHGVKATPVGWPDEEGGQSVLDIIGDHTVDLVINIPKNHTKRELTNGYRIRRHAIDHNIPLLTNARLALAFIKAFISRPVNTIGITSWQEY